MCKAGGNQAGTTPRDAIDAVFGVLDRHISVGQIDKVYQSLPKGIRDLWLEPERPGG